MNATEPGSITGLLRRYQGGEAAARDELLVRLCHQMRPTAGRLMGQEAADHTLQPTALVNEAAARLITQEALGAAPNRAYLFGAAARAMRQVLVDHAREAAARKRGGELTRQPLTDGTRVADQFPAFGLVEIGDAIEALAAAHERASHVVTLRYFAGYTVPEVAEMLGVAVSTVEADWRLARAWLLRELSGGNSSGTDQGG